MFRLTVVTAGVVIAAAAAWLLMPHVVRGLDRHDGPTLTVQPVENRDVFQATGVYVWRFKLSSFPAGQQLVLRESGGKYAPAFVWSKLPTGKDVEVTVVIQFDAPTPAEANRVHFTLKCDGGVVRASQANKYRSFTRTGVEISPTLDHGKAKLIGFSSEEIEHGPEVEIAIEKKD